MTQMGSLVLVFRLFYYIDNGFTSYLEAFADQNKSHPTTEECGYGNSRDILSRSLQTNPRRASRHQNTAGQHNADNI